jgi:acyl-CoA synthetase (AMP-forming)/AMP-acid ligase II
LRLLLPQLWWQPLYTTSSPEVPGEVMERRPLSSDLALISFTSGTTGAPKAIPRSHAFLMAQHRAVAPLLDSTVEERDLVAFPVFVLVNLAGRPGCCCRRRSAKRWPRPKFRPASIRC